MGKKVLLIILTVLVVVLPLTAHAAPQPAPNAPIPSAPANTAPNTTTTADSQDEQGNWFQRIFGSIGNLGTRIEKGFKDTVNGLTDIKNKFTNFYNEYLSFTSIKDKFLAAFQANSPEAFAKDFTMPLKDLMDPISDIFIGIGYLIVTLSWLSALGKKTISLDLFNMKEFLKELGPLLLALFLVGAIPKVCVFIDFLVQKISSSISSKFGISTYVSLAGHSLIDGLIPIVLMLVVLFKLIVRRFMLAFYQIFSPVFGGFAASAGGRKYLTNFLIHYTLLSFSIVIINIALTLYYTVINSTSSLLGKGIGSLIYGIITIGIVVTADKKLEKIFR